MLFVILTATVVVILTVGVHLVALNAISNLLHRLSAIRHVHIGLAVLGAILAHLVEIWVFSAAIRLLLIYGDAGYLRGDFQMEHRDLFYFSAVTYTSLGSATGPIGDVRVFVAIEALTGLVLITWTASFLFLIMQRNWEHRQKK